LKNNEKPVKKASWRHLALLSFIGLFFTCSVELLMTWFNYPFNQNGITIIIFIFGLLTVIFTFVTIRNKEI